MSLWELYIILRLCALNVCRPCVSGDVARLVMSVVLCHRYSCRVHLCQALQRCASVTKEGIALHKMSALQLSSFLQLSFIVFPSLFIFGDVRVFNRCFYKSSFIVFFKLVLLFLIGCLKYVKVEVVDHPEVIGLFWWEGERLLLILCSFLKIRGITQICRKYLYCITWGRFVIVFLKLDYFSYYIRLFEYIGYFRQMGISRMK